MKHFIFLLLFLRAIVSNGQDASPQDSIYTFQQIDKEPVFEGGPEQFKLFLQRNLNYPKNSRKNKVEGRIFIQFVIEPNGTVSNIKILKGLDEHCNAEAIRVVSLMTKWTPGQKNGKDVRTYFNLPLKFTLP